MPDLRNRQHKIPFYNVLIFLIKRTQYTSNPAAMVKDTYDQMALAWFKDHKPNPMHSVMETTIKTTCIYLTPILISLSF